MIDPLILARGVQYSATLLAGGTVAMIWLVAEPAGRAHIPPGFVALRRRLLIVVWFALLATLLSGVAWLTLLASDIADASVAEVISPQGATWPLLFDTHFGIVWCARFALTALLGVLVPWSSARSLQLAAAGALTALLAFAGHAGATPGFGGDLHLISDMAHLLAAGAWLGGLPAFFLALGAMRDATEKRSHDFIVAVTRRFSTLGIPCVAILLASGFVNSWYLLGGPRDLWTTGYGRLVAIKIGLFAAMTVIAAFNKFFLTPRLPDRPALRDLRRGSIAEICLGLGVLAAVAVLGLMEPTTHVHSDASAIPPDAAFVHIHDPAAMADVTIEPGRVGWASVTIRVSREDFSPYPVKVVKVSLGPPQHAGERLEQTATEQPDGTWIVNRVKLAHSGIWTVRVTAINQLQEVITLDAPVVIGR